uniref:Uncharacterized protein n=1 Tax=Rhizophora mucronata TaxID=61149 RepID=A0A2P2NZN6_RHIMU
MYAFCGQAFKTHISCSLLRRLSKLKTKKLGKLLELWAPAAITVNNTLLLITS